MLQLEKSDEKCANLEQSLHKELSKTAGMGIALNFIVHYS